MTSLTRFDKFLLFFFFEKPLGQRPKWQKIQTYKNSREHNTYIHILLKPHVLQQL